MVSVPEVVSITIGADKKAATGKRRGPEHGTAGIESTRDPAHPACQPGRAIAIAMTDPLAEKIPMTPRELCDQELVHAFGQSAVKMVEWIRQCDASPMTKLEVLSRVADVADILRARLKAEAES